MPGTRFREARASLYNRLLVRSLFSVLDSLDYELFRLLRRGAAHPLDGLMLTCARYGSLACVAIMLLAGLRRGAAGRLAVWRCLAAVATVYALVEAIGLLAERTRPFAADASVQPRVSHSAQRSFPSRHVASAVAMAVIVKPADSLLGHVLALLAAGLALGRVRAGLHYPSDVVAGAALGCVVGRALRRENG